MLFCLLSTDESADTGLLSETAHLRDGVQLCTAVPPFLSRVPGLHISERLSISHLYLHLFSLPARDHFLHCYQFPPTANQFAEPRNIDYKK